jgi:3-keto-5-aminohexanoate cleavage enzyme
MFLATPCVFCFHITLIDSCEERKMKPNLASTDKVIITAAITGGQHGREANPNLPLTAEEQGQDALDCYNAGAAVLHLHVRDEEEVNTPEVKYYNKAVRLIGEKTPMIRQIGNGIGVRHHEDGSVGFATLEERFNLVDNIDPTPEMSTINAGTFGFKSALGEVVFLHPLSFNVEYLARCKEAGIMGIEIEVYDTSHIANTMALINEGVLTPPLHFSIVLGVGGGAPATPENLLHMVHQLPEGSTWQVVAVGRHHVPTIAMAIAMGGNVRTGLEDTVYYRRGEPVKSNAQLVERVVRLAHEIGRQPATVEEAKTTLLTGY